MKLYLTLLFSLSLFFVSAQAPTDYFITKWDLSKGGSWGSNSFKFAVSTTGDVNYTWETIPAGTSGTGTITGTTATITGLPVNAIIRLKIDPANFKALNFLYVDGTDVYVDKYRLLDVEQWGTVNWNSMHGTFNGCSNLNITASDMPNLSNVTDMSLMFGQCNSLNSPTNINSWDTSNVTNMMGMFNLARSFNQPIGNWNTSNVTDMNGMFCVATSFNQPIGNWNTGAVTDMQQMFRLNPSFNQPIGNWNTGNVTNMNHMFDQATVFNQPIGNWNTSNVTDMSFMFCWARSFKQPIGNWNVSNVTDMRSMFNDAISFNQPIGDWNTSSVRSMRRMFAGSNNGIFDTTLFNQPIGNWNVSNVTDMNSMFKNTRYFNQPIGNWNVSEVTDMDSMFNGAKSFNQPVGNWNVSNVIDMGDMFGGAIVFNQPIVNWNVSNVTDMGSMFQNATSFDQPVENWNVSNVTNMFRMFLNATTFNQSLGNWTLNSNVNMVNMLDNAGFDCNNYTDTITGWSNNVNTPNNITLGAVGLNYGVNSLSNRNLLTDPVANGGKGWAITGDIQSSDNCGALDIAGFENAIFSAYPNPTKGIININLKNNANTIDSILVTDVLGKTVQSNTIHNSSATIDLSQLTKGLYFVKIQAEGQVKILKVVKE